MWQSISNRVRSGRHKGAMRHIRILGSLALLAFASASSAFGQPDVMIKDCSNDIGQPGDPQCYDTYYLSPDIWIRLAKDGQLQHQQPVAGQDAYVYVRVTNIGNTTLESGTVEIYYGAASTSLSNWPSKWTCCPPNGGFLGSVPVNGLPPSGTTNVWVKWSQVPSNSNGDHFCILARFVSDEDPMTTAEGTIVHDNVMHNNNIGWKNLWTIYPPPLGNQSVEAGTIAVYNGEDDLVTMRLDFDSDQPGADESLPDNFQVRLKLGELYDRWVNGGRVGEGPGIIDEPWSNAIVITNRHESIGGIDVGPGEEFGVDVEILYSSEAPPNPNIHNWNVSQWEDGREDAIGGIGFEIHMDGAAGKRAVRSAPDLDMKLGLSAQPNVGSSTMTIGFTLLSDDQVTLAIYDLNGRLVRTLLSANEQTAGRHEVVWDGTSGTGAPAASGTYIYRLTTKGGTVEKQLKIVR